MDDRTVGLVLRALRRRRGWRQADLAARAECSQSLVSTIERGHLAGIAVDRLRSVFGAVDARVLVEPRWRGAELDRLLDVEHAAIVEALAQRLESDGWQAIVEVTYSMAGERGSIDILGLDPARRGAIVCEVKSDLAAAEAVGRKLDEKGRLAAAIVRERFGWTPIHIATVLVMPESPRLRRLLGGPAAALSRMFPVAGRAVATWLRKPWGRLAATWFLSNISVRNARRIRRVKSPSRASPPSATPFVPNGDPADLRPMTRILR